MTSVRISQMWDAVPTYYKIQKNILMSRSMINKENEMFNWALTFLIIAIIAGVLGFSGIAGTATQIAWIAFVVGIIMAIFFFLTGRGTPPS